MSSIAVKVTCKSEIRRARIPSMSLEELESTALEIFPEFPQGSFDINYRDDEGDLCRLNQGTFPDFAFLNKDATTLKLELVPKKSAPAAASSQPLAGQMGGLMGLLLAGGACLEPLLLHFMPVLVQQLRMNCEKIEKRAVEKPMCAREVMRVVRSGLEKFPEFQATCAAVDQLLAAEELHGLGVALEGAVRTFEQLNLQMQLKVLSTLVASATERAVECHNAHKGESQECHTEHEGRSEETRGRCKGQDKGKPKGKIRFAVRSSSSSSSSSDSSSRQERKEALKVLRGHWRAQKRRLQAEKEVKKLGSSCEEQGKVAEGTAAEGKDTEDKDFKLPVQLASGGNLSISWNRGEVAAEVAARVAKEHDISSEDVPMITHLVAHVQAAAPPQLTPQAQPVEVKTSYGSQVTELEQMGFMNRELNVELLAAHRGDLKAVLEKLL